MRKVRAGAPVSNNDIDLGSFEGKYPKQLFNKSFVIDNQTIGHVAKDNEETVVVFSELDGDIRYDIPKSEIVPLGGSVTVRDASALESYKMDRDSPFPKDERTLRPTADEIRKKAAELQPEKLRNRSRNSAEAVLIERRELGDAPRHDTRTVSIPEGYVEPTESNLSKQLKRAIKEFKELFYAGSKVAKKKIKEEKARIENARAEMDSERIGNMGDLATNFAQDYDRILDEIRARPISEQAKMYDGLITLMEFQRRLAIARRDMASKVTQRSKRATRRSTSQNTLRKEEIP